MLTRRAVLAAWAPVPKPGYRGEVLAAAYEGLQRRTRIWFRVDGEIWEGEFDHDRSRVKRPVLSVLPELEQAEPRIVLRREGRWIVSADDRRQLTRLMVVPEEARVEIVYPVRAHPDLRVLWSWSGRIYFTNNDYKNIYGLPERMSGEWEKTRRVNP